MKYKITINSYSYPKEGIVAIIDHDVMGRTLCEEIVSYLEYAGDRPHLLTDAKRTVRHLLDYAWRYGNPNAQTLVGAEKPGGPCVKTLIWRTTEYYGFV